MRLVTRKIHRAFPELDRYSDAQCDRFVSAAGRGFRRNAIVFACCLAVGTILLLAGLFGAGMIEPVFRRPTVPNSPYRSVLAGLLALAGVIAAPFAGYWTRDILLIRRIRTILRKRGHCTACGYNLVGLPVSAQCAVVCPECAVETKVDPALGELTTVQAGQRVFELSDDTVLVIPPFWTPGKKKFLKRAAIAAAILVFGVLPATWGVYELFLTRQAAVARRERPGLKALMALVEKNQRPDAGPGTPDAWDAFAESVRIQEGADTRVWKGGKVDAIDGVEPVPDFGLLLPRRRGRTATAQYEQACRALAVRMMSEYRNDGLYESFSRLAAAKRSVHEYQVNAGEPMIGVMMPELGRARDFARLNAARMTVAMQEKNLHEFTDALEANLAIGRILSTEPFLLGTLTAAAADGLTLERIRALLQDNPDPEWINAARACIDRQHIARDPSYPFETERLMSLDSIGWVFSEPSRVRFGRFSDSNIQFLGRLNPLGSIGTYVGNRDAVNTLYNDMIVRVKTPEQERSSLARTSRRTGYALVDLLAPSFGRTIGTIDQWQWGWVEIELLLAMHAHRIDHGEYPATLSELTPVYLRKLPLDPRTGRPVGYRRIEATAPAAPFELFPLPVEPSVPEPSPADPGAK